MDKEDVINYERNILGIYRSYNALLMLVIMSFEVYLIFLDDVYWTYQKKK